MTPISVGRPRCCSPTAQIGMRRPLDPVSTTTGTLGPPFTETFTAGKGPFICSGTVPLSNEPTPAAPLLPYTQPPTPPAPPPPWLPPVPPSPPLPNRTALPPPPPVPLAPPCPPVPPKPISHPPRPPAPPAAL